MLADFGLTTEEFQKCAKPLRLTSSQIIAKKIIWSVEARADIRAINTAMRLLIGIARFSSTTESSDVKRLEGYDPPRLRLGNYVYGLESPATVLNFFARSTAAKLSRTNERRRARHQRK